LLIPRNLLKTQERSKIPAYMARPLFFNLHGCGQDCGGAAKPPYPRVGEVRIQPVPVKFTSIAPVPQLWNKVPQVLRVNSKLDFIRQAQKIGCSCRCELFSEDNPSARRFRTSSAFRNHDCKKHHMSWCSKISLKRKKTSRLVLDRAATQRKAKGSFFFVDSAVG